MKNDELDNLIDGALSEYSSAEPLEALEARVLRRVKMARPAGRSAWPFRLGFAIPALAVLALTAVGLWVAWNSQPRSPALTELGPAPQPPAPAIEPRQEVKVARETTARPRPLPKKEYFPTPAPLTDEERRLVAWVQRAPLEAVQAFADLQKRSAEPIEVQPIQIAPLPGDGAQ